MLNKPEDILHPQITTSVYGTPVFRGVVIVDIGHLQGCLAWLNTWQLVAFCAGLYASIQQNVNTETQKLSDYDSAVRGESGMKNTSTLKKI